MPNDILRWANENQGTLSIVLFSLGLLIAWITGLLKIIFNKLFKSKQSPNVHVKGNLKSGGPIVIGNNNRIIMDNSKSSVEKQVEEMETKLEEVMYKIEQGQNLDRGVSQLNKTKINMQEYNTVLEIQADDKSSENKAKLRTLYYTTTDKIVQIQIILVLAGWYMPREDNLEDLIALCDQGITLANEINRKEEKSVLLAYKGNFISLQFSDLDFETASRNLIANELGVSSTTEEEYDEVVKKLNYLYESSSNYFKEAEKLAKEINSYRSLGLVYRLIGAAAGERFIHLKAFGVDMAEDEKQLSKRAFMLSKNIYASANDEVEVAYTYYNFANQLRSFGEKEEALSLLNESKSIATRYNEASLIEAANLLSDRIRTGSIPDIFS